MSAPSSSAVLLRAATVWGTTVLTTRMLKSGDSLDLSATKETRLAKPETSQGADLPIRAVGAGWELDARGATGGEIVLRGRSENPAQLGESGAPIPIVAGDFGLIQYGNFSVFFQFTQAPEPLPKGRRISWPLILSFLFSSIAVGGGLLLLWAITTPQGILKPLELTSTSELALKFRLDPYELMTESPTQEAGGSTPVEEKEKEQRPPSAARRAPKAEGRLGRTGYELKPEQPGERQRGLGGMAEVLSSDVGEEVRKTLGTISSVAEALGGLRSDSVILGQGQGLSLRGTASGGGGDREGVPFGAGALETGWGSGRGTGSGNAGAGRGLGGGQDRGTGSGDAASERKLATKDAPRAGQGLSPAQIQRVVLSRMGAFQACYEIASGRDPNLQGGVTVSFGIAPSGSVSNVSISSSSLGNPRVEGCITRQFGRLQFPAADKPTNAVYPFVFRPSKR